VTADETSENVGPAPAKIPDHAKLVNELTTAHQFATLEDSDEILLLTAGAYRPGAEAIVRRMVESKYRSTGGSARHQLVNEVLHGIRRRTYVPRDKFNPSGKLCLKNGVLDLGTLEVVPHAIGDHFTMQVPAEYDPRAECPRWLEFIDEIQPKAEVRTSLRMAVGYNLSPRNEYNKAFMLYGPGNNGKSTFLRAITALLGKDNVAAVTLQGLAGNRFASAELWGKLANVCADIPSNPIPYTGLFKMVTGEDYVYAERKYAHPFKFVCGAKPWFSANQLPQVTDKTVAFWRRWEAWEFAVDFTGKEDRNLLGKLSRELSGILNWALAGLADLRKAGGFPRTIDADALKELWKKRADALYWFVSEGCEIGSTLSVPKDDFYQSYAEFAASKDVRAKTREEVGTELLSIAPSVRRAKPRGPDGKQVHTWLGITVKPEFYALSPSSSGGRAPSSSHPEGQIPVSPVSPVSATRQKKLDETGEPSEPGGRHPARNGGPGEPSETGILDADSPRAESSDCGGDCCPSVPCDCGDCPRCLPEDPLSPEDDG
jgi:putative DNA primase/helicase